MQLTPDHLERGTIFIVDRFLPFNPQPPSSETPGGYVPTPPSYSIMPGVPLCALTLCHPYLSCFDFLSSPCFPPSPAHIHSIDLRCVVLRSPSHSFVADYLLSFAPSILPHFLSTYTPEPSDGAPLPCLPLSALPSPNPHSPSLQPPASVLLERKPKARSPRRPPSPPTSDSMT